MYQVDQSIIEYLKLNRVEEDKLVDMSVYLTENKFMLEIRKDLDKKDADEASKIFNSIKAKFRIEKDKYLKMNVDLNKMINYLFEGN